MHFMLRTLVSITNFIFSCFGIRHFIATRIARSFDSFDFQKLALSRSTSHFAKVDTKIVVACWTPTNDHFSLTEIG